jgi:hypothetical protein
VGIGVGIMFFEPIVSHIVTMERPFLHMATSLAGREINGIHFADMVYT